MHGLLAGELPFLIKELERRQLLAGTEQNFHVLGREVPVPRRDVTRESLIRDLLRRGVLGRSRRTERRRLAARLRNAIAIGRCQLLRDFAGNQPDQFFMRNFHRDSCRKVMPPLRSEPTR